MGGEAGWFVGDVVEDSKSRVPSLLHQDALASSLFVKSLGIGNRMEVQRLAAARGARCPN